MQMPPQHFSDYTLAPDAFTSSALASFSASRDESTLAFTNKQAIGLKILLERQRALRANDSGLL
jgi:hypothetical protein